MARSLALLIALLLAVPPAAAPAHPGSAIAVDRAGRVFFVLFGTSEILRVDARGKVAVFVSDDRIRVPHHLVMDAEGYLYTVSDDDGRIWRIDPDGRLASFHAPEPAAPRVGSGGDPFTLDRSGAIYFVAERERHRIARLVAGGVERFGPELPRMGSLHGSSMAWGPDGSLYVTDGSRVHRLAPDGRTSTVVGEPSFRLAMGVAVSPAGHVLVADYLAGAVVRIAPSGETAVLGARVLRRPSGVALGPDQAVYVLDNTFRGGRVWRLTDDSETLVACSGMLGPLAEHAILLGVPLLLIVFLWVGRRRPLRERVLRAIMSGVVMIPIFFLGSVGCAGGLVRVGGVVAVASAALASFTTWRRPTPESTEVIDAERR